MSGSNIRHALLSYEETKSLPKSIDTDAQWLQRQAIYEAHQALMMIDDTSLPELEHKVSKLIE